MSPVYAIVDTAIVCALGLTVQDCAGAMLEGGIRLLQIRRKDQWTQAAVDEAAAVSELCRSAGAQLVIDDRSDVAALLGVGIHVGQEDLPPAEARAIAGQSALLGYSTHNEEQFRAALSEPVDYIAFGPIYQTGSKLNPDPVVGLEELRRLRSLTGKPLVAIGGITRFRAPDVWRAGADSVAIIADLYPPDATLNSIRDRAAEWTKMSKQ